MVVRLMGFRISPFVEKVVRGLRYKKIDFEELRPGSPFELRKWSPTGKMPVLDWDGERIYDSTFILRKLDEAVAAPAFFAAEPRIAAKQRLLEDWSDESLYWYTMALRWAEPNAEASTEQVAVTVPALLRPLVRPMLRRQISAMARAQGLARLPYEVLVSEYGKRLDELVMLLRDQPFFYAEPSTGLSAADLAIFGQLTAARSGPTPDAEQLILHRPVLTDWMKRVDTLT
jgi:glutathione S-transferase